MPRLQAERNIQWLKMGKKENTDLVFAIIFCRQWLDMHFFYGMGEAVGQMAMVNQVL
jgi:hypothetical protein